jgi:hypothetical protein
VTWCKPLTRAANSSSCWFSARRFMFAPSIV